MVANVMRGGRGMQPRVEELRLARRQACQWRDLLWESVVDELAERDLAAASAARTAIGQEVARALYGSSTRDAQARLDWVWVCQYVHTLWARDLATEMELAS
jgi:hypothetical protein